MLEWQDITVSVDFMIPKQAKPELSACVATRIDQMWRQGIALCVRSETWILSIGGPKLGGVYEEGNIIANVTGPILARNTFHRLSLTTVGGKASAKLNGKYIFSEIAVRDIDTGFAGIGMSDWASVEFDNISL